VRWANQKSAIRWLTDFTRLIEEYGWDWSYHAYQEFHGWSVEYSDSLGDMRTPLETDRKALLLSYFALNKNPYDSLLLRDQMSAIAHPENPLRVLGNGTSHPAIYGLSKNDDIRIADIRGRFVSIKQSGEVLRLDAAAQGFYLVRVRSGHGTTILKVLVLR
jgi:hypothetical protein